MKKLTILLTIILVMVQVSIQAQIRSDNTTRNMLHHNTYKEGCGVVSNIFVDEITRNTATIHWNTNGAMQYILVYVNNNDKQDRGTLITPLGSVAIDNLTPCSNYKFFILAKCPDGTYRSYPQVFSTLGCN